jgi:hypothetical protein
MDSINFLRNNFAQMSVQPQVEKPSNSEVVPPVNPTKFSHGSNVILKSGTYKGYHGYVYDDDVRPVRYEVEIDEEQYVLVEKYGTHEIGTTIETEYGDAKIVGHVPMMLAVTVGVTSPEQGRETHEVHLPQQSFARVVAFRDQGSIKLALFDQVTEGVEVRCHLRVLNLNYEPQFTQDTEIHDLYQQLSKSLIQGRTLDNLIGDEHECQTSQLLLPDMFFVNTPTQKNTKKIDYLGYYGPLKRVIGEQYRIVYPKRILLFKKQFTRNGKTITVTKGPYRGITGTFIEKHPPQIIVYIDALGRKVNDHLVKTGTDANGAPQFERKPLTTNDVFYLDFLLTNGNYFQVLNIRDSSHIVGIEKVLQTGFVPREISMDEVEKTLPGFSFFSENNSIQPNPESNYQEVQLVADEPPSDEPQEDEDELQESDDVDYETNEANEANEVEVEAGQNEPELKASFKDMERSSYAPTKLNKEQTKIRSLIVKVISLQGLPESELPIWEIIEQVEQAVIKMKQDIRKFTGEERWVPSDQKFIVACLVMYQIIRSDFAYMFINKSYGVIESFLNKLISAKFFTRADIAASYFIKKGWTLTFDVNLDVVKTLTALKNYQELYQLIFDNCNTYLRSLYQLPDLKRTNRVYQPELIPLTRKEKGVVKKYITIPELIKSDKIPVSVTRILWGPAYQTTLYDFKEALSNKILASQNSGTTREVYEYVLENIEQAPFEFARMKTVLKQKHRELDRKKVERLQTAWKLLLRYVAEDYQKLQTEHEQNAEKLRENLETITNKRKAALDNKTRNISHIENMLNDMSLEKNESDDSDINTDLDLAQSYKKVKMGDKTFKVPIYFS